MIDLADLQEALLPANLHAELINHCRRKLHEDYLPDEVPERKAYGLLGGHIDGHLIRLSHVFPFRKNLRHDPLYREDIDELMTEWAVPSETVLQRRGWVTDPREVLTAQRTCDATGAELFASYHMHRVPWPHDPLRDTCTTLDRQMARDSGLWMFIISMVDPDRPIVRAFFEGKNELELPIRLLPPS